MKWKIQDLIRVSQGELISKNQEFFHHVNVDTRSQDSLKGAAFFALQGQRDGHDFIHQAYKKGCQIFVVEKLSSTRNLKLPVTVICVKDTLKALVDLASFHRKNLKCQVVAITGSNGKTSAKHFLQILLKDVENTHFSKKSFNNILGVSLTLLEASPKTQILVQEIGTNRDGEIAKLCSIVQPDVVVCINVHFSHLLGLGSIEKIAKEKKNIYLSCAQSQFLFNLDNPWTRKMYDQLGSQKSVTFSSQDKNADVFLKVQNKGLQFLDIEGVIKNQKGSCRLKLAGEHHLPSLMTAAGLSLILGQSPQNIWDQFSKIHLPPMRCEFLKISDDLLIFFDAYNSNPQSLSCFLDHISFSKKSFVLCLGDMLELGEEAPRFHKELGQKVGGMNWSHLFFIGQHGKDFKQGLIDVNYSGPYNLFKTYDSQSGSQILSKLRPQDILAVKASRGLKLERIVEDLKKKESLS